MDNLTIADIDMILEPNHSGEILVMMVEFKTSINAYLKELINSPVSSLADIIAFNENNPELVFHLPLSYCIVTFSNIFPISPVILLDTLLNIHFPED